MMETILFCGVVLVVVFAFFVAWKAQTMFLGFTWLTLFYVFSCSLSGFAHAFAFGADLNWFSVYHQKVVQYSIFGCLAMVLGTMLGGRKRGRNFNILEGDIHWLNARMAGLLYVMGLSATILLFFFRGIPTLSTALEQLTLFKNIGIVVFVVDAMKQNSWKLAALAGILHSIVAMSGALASGHTPFEVNLMIPLACVLTGARGVTLKTTGLLCGCAAAFFLLFVGWMDNRIQIRSGQLEQASFSDASGTLGMGILDSITSMEFDVNSSNARIRERIDMTDILALQAHHQPEFEPYSYGSTFADAGIALIPRVLWSSKPVIAGGSDFVARFTGIVRSTEDSTSVGLPYPFELYANGGSQCVVIGLFIIGWIVARFEIHCIFATMSLAKRLGVISILITLASGGQRMNLLIPAMTAGFLTSWTVGYLLERFAPRFSAQVQGLVPDSK